jgi:hypothetical protein
MTQYIGIALVGLLSLPVLVACDKPGEAEVKKEYAAVEQAGVARLQSDLDIAAARETFNKVRDDYRHQKEQDLVDLDEKLSDLETKARTATASDKAVLATKVPSLREQREAFVRDLEALETVAPASWDGLKAGLDKQWAALKNAVDQAS